MAARVIVDEVRAIMPPNELDDLVVQAYIDSAHVWVDATLISYYSEDMLKEIEKWMSAHMIASTQERISKEEGAGGAFIKYAGKWEEGLLSTPYGQMVLNLDIDKFIDTIDGSRKPKSAWTKAVSGV